MTARDVPAPTPNSAALVYGEPGPEPDDPAELFHEASKLDPSLAAVQARGIMLIDTNEQLRRSVHRSVKRSPHLPLVPLPVPEPLAVPLGEALACRRSRRAAGGGELTAGELSQLLHAAYGVTLRLELPEGQGSQAFRAAPSGGALYPLELFAALAPGNGLDAGLYHYDPLLHGLEALRTSDVAPELAAALVLPETLEGCAAFFIVGALFWRTRVKYGLRGYRYALLEAGHLAQNLLLAAAALDLPAFPVGGFYDRRLDDLLGLDGVNESTVYAVSVGGSGPV